MRFLILAITTMALSMAHAGPGKITKKDRPTLVGIRVELKSAEQKLQTHYKGGVDHVRNAVHFGKELPDVPSKQELLQALKQGLRYHRITNAPETRKAVMMQSAINYAQISLDRMLTKLGLQAFNLKQVNEVLEKTRKQLQRGNEYATQNILKRINNKASNKKGPAGLKQQIAFLVDFTIGKVTDPYLSKSDKMFIYDDCTASLKKFVAKLLSKQGPPENKFKKVGETYHFSKHEIQKDIIQAAGEFNKKASSIKVKALDDSVFIKAIRVVKADGSVQVFNDITLAENGNKVLTFPKGKVSKIVIRAKSAKPWGTKGKLAVFLK